MSAMPDVCPVCSTPLAPKAASPHAVGPGSGARSGRSAGHDAHRRRGRRRDSSAGIRARDASISPSRRPTPAPRSPPPRHGPGRRRPCGRTSPQQPSRHPIPSPRPHPGPRPDQDSPGGLLPARFRVTTGRTSAPSRHAGSPAEHAAAVGESSPSTGRPAGPGRAAPALAGRRTRPPPLRRPLPRPAPPAPAPNAAPPAPAARPRRPRRPRHLARSTLPRRRRARRHRRPPWALLPLRPTPRQRHLRPDRPSLRAPIPTPRSPIRCTPHGGRPRRHRWCTTCRHPRRSHGDEVRSGWGVW